MSTKFLQIVGSNFDSKSIVTLKVPILEDGATDYTEADKASVKTAINQIADTDKPIVILDYNGAYLPANYFTDGSFHHFTAIRTDAFVCEEDLYVIDISYLESINSLSVIDDMKIVSNGGNNNELEESVEILKQQVADLMYKPIEITSFTNNIGIIEKGSTVTKIFLSWVINKIPTTIVLDNENIEVELTNITLNNLYITSDKTWTMRVTDEREAVSTKSTKLSFLNGVYYGAINNNDNNNIDSDTILELTKKLQSTKSITFSVTANDGQYVIFALPTSYGVPSFKDKDTGFEAGFYKAKTFDFTNNSDYTESYDVWLSTNAGLGTMNIIVS